MKRKVKLVSLLLLVPLALFADFNLKTNEKLLFGFHTPKGKSLSIAIDQNNRYIVYRFSKGKKVELQYPKNLTHSFKKFTYSYYMRGGMGNAGEDLNYLRFQVGPILYVVYDEYTSDDDSRFVGIKVRDANSGKEYADIQGDPKTVTGSLSDFRDLNVRQDDRTDFGE